MLPVATSFSDSPAQRRDGRAGASPSGRSFLAGVLGGMGPASSADFCLQLVRATPAYRDQDHIRVAMWSDPQIPDRTSHLTGRGPSPLPSLLHGLERLTSLGVDVVAIACNTAHAYLPTLRQHSDTPILDMVTTTAERCRDEHGAGTRIGLLGTTGTLRSEIYDAALDSVGLAALHPDQRGQGQVMDAIALVKASDRSGRAASQIRDEAARLADRGASALIFACTEVGLAIDSVLPIAAHDPVAITARQIVAMRSLRASGGSAGTEYSRSAIERGERRAQRLVQPPLRR